MVPSVQVSLVTASKDLPCNWDIIVSIFEKSVSPSERGSATEAVTSRKVCCNRSFFNLERIIQARLLRVQVPTCRMEMELDPFFVSSSFNLLAFCPISGRMSTDFAYYLQSNFARARRKPARTSLTFLT
jgi:hypothetical protein